VVESVWQPAVMALTAALTVPTTNHQESAIR
jgi:hypothetical protein